MFVCRIFIAPGGVGSSFEEQVEQSLQKLARRFDEFCPVVTAINHCIDLKSVNRKIVAEIDAFLTAMRVKYDLHILEECTDAELASAQYVELSIAGYGNLDSDREGNPLNQYSPGACQSCGLPPDDEVPNPLMIA